VESINLEALRWNHQGLIPTVVQDANTRQVLMLAYSNHESLRLSLESRETWFWSRSRQVLWHKGATSGNVQYIASILVDCDADTILMLVHPAGPACHTGAVSCFYRELTNNVQGESE
jgi:phosphoribosyl-ATP pyrophosphohydrolase/phosphoribosyl-AMP cyclohydrolase